MSRHHWSIVRIRRIIPKVMSVAEWKWNHIARPDVIRSAPIAPVRGQGLGSTMWNACVWWVIKYFLVNKELIRGQIRRLELWQQQFLGG